MQWQVILQSPMNMCDSIMVFQEDFEVYANLKRSETVRIFEMWRINSFGRGAHPVDDV